MGHKGQTKGHAKEHATRLAPQAPKVLVTAGPTHEPIDPVRFIGNRSSGRLGIAIAIESVRRGTPTTLLLGPVGELVGSEDPRLVIRRFRTAAELEALLREESPRASLVVMTAAVADFRPRQVATTKIPRGRTVEEGLRLDLEPVPDLVAALAARRPPGQRICGFALESAERLEARAMEKLRSKGLDAVVANPLETMDAPTIAGRLLHADGRVELPPGHPSPLGKEAFAAWLLDRLMSGDAASGA